jgi:hypothetical protein
MESEEEEDELPPAKERRKSKDAKVPKPKKKRVRKVKSKRGYYASSEEDEVEVVESLPAKKPRRKCEIDEVLGKVFRIFICSNKTFQIEPIV